MCQAVNQVSLRCMKQNGKENIKLNFNKKMYFVQRTCSILQMEIKDLHNRNNK